MIENEKHGAPFIAVGVFCICVAAMLKGSSFVSGATPWARLYAAYGHVSGATSARLPTEAETPVAMVEEVAVAAPPPPPSLVVPVASAPGVPSPERLLRRYPVQLYSSASGPGRAYHWIENNGNAIDVRVDVAADQRLLLLMNDVQVLVHACGLGVCTVAVNQREDGHLLVRFKDDASALALLLNAQNEVQRWQGAAVPPMAPAANASVVMDPLPAVVCAAPSECARLSTLLWQARNHRYAAAYAIASGPAPSTLYTLASVYASAGDAVRTAEYLGQVPERERRRVARDHDFDLVRAHAGVQSVLDPSTESPPSDHLYGSE